MCRGATAGTQEASILADRAGWVGGACLTGEALKQKEQPFGSEEQAPGGMWGHIFHF